MKINSTEKLSNCQKQLNKLFSNLRMSTILLIYSFLIFCLTFSILILCSNIQLNVTKNQISETSEQLLTLQNNRALNIQSEKIQDILSFTFNMIITKVAKLSLINYWSSSLDLKINQEIMPCQASQQFNENIQRTLVCYSNSNHFQQRNIDKIKIFKLMNLLYINQYTFDFFTVSHEVYLVSFLDNFLTGYYLTKLKNESFEIVQQEWFLNYTIELQQSNQIVPYKLSSLIKMENYDNILSAFSIVLFDSQFIVGGVASILINFHNIAQFAQVSSLNIILVYDDGLILYTKSYINFGIAKDLLYIYDEQQTGFNNSDWKDIKLSIDNTLKPIYKYNSLLKCQMHIKASRQPKTTLISLILTNLTFENEITYVLDDEISKVLTWHTQTNLYFITIGVIIILITLIPLKFMFNSTSIVIAQMIRYLNGKFDYKLKDNLLNRIQSQSNNNSLKQLQFSYQKLDQILNKTQFKKSEQCLAFENFRFTKQQNIKLNFCFEKLIDQNQCLSQKQFVQIIKFPNEERNQKDLMNQSQI
ncbi:unnamed protein product [Paramecium sonneborni]|uniref:Transmembrane protein n=1 Tax=Paramecium sonneborni TaxID=65129 RepID=A0A8S1LAZ7_9CILI|nr:unnamed protein product [Paramecium sonneborni]